MRVDEKSTSKPVATTAVGAIVVRLACTWLFAIALDMVLVSVCLGSTADFIVRSARLASARIGCVS
jgi:hypothetical protein